jgi:exo-beta-1,3-glucanase (GH17 family)
MKQCVEKAKAKNIRVGVHTLTNFITTNDPFVTTNVNSGLMAAGISLLQADIDEGATEIVVDNYEYFAQVSTLNSVLIGNEIIRYQEVTSDRSLPELKNGKHVITIEAGTMEGEEPVIKGTVKLKGGIEVIKE